MWSLAGVKEVKAIGELVKILTYKLEKDTNIKEAFAWFTQKHGVSGEDIQLKPGYIVDVITREKTKIECCPGHAMKNPSKPVDEKEWEQEVSQAKRKRR